MGVLARSCYVAVRSIGDTRRSENGFFTLTLAFKSVSPPRRPEPPFGYPLVRMPHVISGQMDVFPGQRR